MAFPPSNYVACFPLQAYFVDKDTGLPLSAGTVNFFEDEARTLPKDVFIQQQQPDNSYVFVNIGATVTLSSVGTTQYIGTDTIIFLFPFDADGNKELYYIQVLSSVGVLQLTREAWPPNTQSTSPSSTSFIGSDNVVSNPQFAEVSFSAAPAAAITFTITGAGSTQIAPDWSIVTPSAGQAIVQQIAVVDPGAVPGLPAFALSINVSGFSGSVALTQTIDNSPRLLENGFISGTFLVQSNSGTSTVSMNYVPSNPALSAIVVASGVANLGGYTEYHGNVATPVSPDINTDSGLIGNIQIQMILQNNADVRLSCIQVVSAMEGENVEYIQESTPRQKDHLFHYWQQWLNYKPIPSFLVGWDFPLNPGQFPIGTAPASTNTSFYVLDQTIVFQSAASAITATRFAPTNSLLLTAAATTQMAILQYLDGYKKDSILLESSITQLSVNVNIDTHVSQTFTVSLWWTANSSLPAIGSNASLINTLDSQGHPNSVVAGWNEIKSIYGPTTVTTVGGSLSEQFQFSGFIDETAYQTAVFFAIVVGTDSVAMGDNVDFLSVSLVAGAIPTVPAPQTQDQVLRECQYYYEQSYAPGVSGASATNAAISPMQSAKDNTTTAAAYATNFAIRYAVPKRVTPSVALYSLAGTIATVTSKLNYSLTVTAAFTTQSDEVTFASYWNATTGINATTCTPKVISLLNSAVTATSTNSFTSACITYNYVIDARLGVV